MKKCSHGEIDLASRRYSFIRLNNPTKNPGYLGGFVTASLGMADSIESSKPRGRRPETDLLS